MLFLNEHQRAPERLADYLPWAGLVAPGVVEQKDGLLQATIAFRAPDLSSSTKGELVASSARLNNFLKRLGSGWTVFVEAQRRSARDYPESSFPEKTSALVDEERRRMFEAEGSHYESSYFLTLVYAPPKEKKQKVLGWLFESGEDEEEEKKSPEEYLERFQNRLEELESLLKGVFPMVERLGDQATLEYLHSTVSTKRQPIAVPETPFYLDALLVDQPLEVGLELQLGETFLQTVVVQGFPSETVPGILDQLNRLQFPYRWSTRWKPYDKQDARSELKKYQKRWYSQRQGILSVISQLGGGEGSALQNSDAVRKAEDADAALQELGSDAVAFGEFTQSVTVWGDTRDQVAERAKTVETVVQSQGFTTIRESFNALEAWLGSLPGHVYANKRRPLIHSLNVAHLVPSSAVWSGPEENEHLEAPAHVQAATTGGTPFRLTTNVGDVGHTLVLGPTGAGKSTLLSLLALQWRRYHGQVFIFDKGRSSRAATLAVGGEFFNLDVGGEEVAFQPLGEIDDKGERIWARDWVLEILEAEGVKATPERKERISRALQRLAERDREFRTLGGLRALVQDKVIKQGLGEFAGDGAYASLFDADDEQFALSDWVTFEMSELMDVEGVVAPALSYLFHRVEQRWDGTPTMMILDEAWLFLDNPQFRGKIREWLKVARKHNVYVVFATQQISDALDSEVSPVILENCLTRILLPNSRALNPSLAEYYRELGLNEQQVRLLANAQPKREYYYSSPRGNRLFELGLEHTPATLALCGSSAPEDQEMMDAILERHGKADFAEWFFREKDLAWAADAVARDDGEAAAYDRTVAEEADPVAKIFGSEEGA